MRSLSWWKKARAVFVVYAATATAAPAQSFTTLVNFDGNDGDAAASPLVQGVDGNLYGATGQASNSYGTVFKMTPVHPLKTIYSFN